METIFNENINCPSLLNESHAKIITIEGIDGAGKTSVVTELKRLLEGLGYKVSHFNTSSLYNMYWDTVKNGIELGLIDNEVNQLLHNIAFLTYIKTIFIKLLNTNDFVISEWYIYGKMVLSELYSDQEENFSKKILLSELENGKIITPDYSFYLDVSPEIAYDRIIKRKGKFELKEKYEFLKKAVIIWEKYIRTYNMIKLDATESIEEIGLKTLKRIMDSHG